jgi:heat shock protein HslJ
MYYKLSLTLALLLSVACNRHVATQHKTGSVWNYIQQKRWKVIQINGKMQEQPAIWIEFNTSAQRITGNGGCNRLSGAYSLSGDTITFKQVVSTRMACADQQANETESLFLKLLSERAYTFDVADQTLQLYYADKIVVMFGAMNKTDH